MTRIPVLLSDDNRQAFDADETVVSACAGFRLEHWLAPIRQEETLQ